jgi:Xaa-Pro aminopeptidase
VNALEQRRQRVADAWGLDGDIVVVPAGEPISIPGTDQYYPFQAHPEFRYLADLNLPGSTLAFDSAAKTWQVFVPRPDANDRMWHGDVPEIGRPATELEAWLDERKDQKLLHIADEASGDRRLSDLVSTARVVKDADELGRMRRAAAATVVGFDVVYASATAGMTERDVEAELEVGFRRGGGDAPAYDSIVATGRNAAVLHYEPTTTVVEPGDFILIDAAASVDGYACDCTRTFVVGAEPNQKQRDIHAIVTAAQAVGVEKCVPGAEYRAIHIETAIQMTEGLVEIGLLRGEPTDLVARGVAAVFFPHGVGHGIGLSVHDVAGYAPGRERTTSFGTEFLRMDRPLQEGMVVTIEPGIYFIPALLEGATRFADDIDLALAEDYVGIGGVRVEDCVHVTAEGPENLTIGVPKVLGLPFG